MGNKKKEATLGMPYGTAIHRLRKSILFNLVSRLKEDICFKCKKRIDTINELSIEHKLPWENRSSDLFWDLNNIAFSHLRCNRPHRFPGPGRKQHPEGLLWCAGHKEYLPIENFYKKSSNWTGYQVNCKKCHDIKRGRKDIMGL